jgi:2-methylisocitrate lyase-like PEP mutase family enzyme
MNKQLEFAATFGSLHQPGRPLVLFNAWDAGSAKIVAQTGAKAIATGSWSVAAALGYDDGEQLPMSLALANLERIVSCVEVPVTVDLEAGYGNIGETARAAVKAGAVGFNFEDGRIGAEGLQPIAAQADRIREARTAVDAVLANVFINARTDMFLRAPADQHSDEMVEDALARASAYAKAGANGVFVPGLSDPQKIKRICDNSPLPVNIMGKPGTTKPSELAKLGVARISYGPFPYRLAMEALRQAASEANTSL